MHCLLCDGLMYGGGLEAYHNHCARVQDCLEEKFWPEGPMYDMVPHLYKKYGLSLHFAPTYNVTRTAGAIRNHWLVCRFLEEHPGAVRGFILRRMQYYDVLAAAEKRYLGRTEYTISRGLLELGGRGR